MGGDCYVGKVVSPSRVNSVAKVGEEGEGLPSQATLNEGVVDTEAIEFIASRNANAVESKHSLEQGCVLDASGVGCYRPHELFDLESVEEDNGVRRSIEVFSDWFMW